MVNANKDEKITSCKFIRASETQVSKSYEDDEDVTKGQYTLLLGVEMLKCRPDDPIRSIV